MLENHKSWCCINRLVITPCNTYYNNTGSSPFLSTNNLSLDLPFIAVITETNPAS